MVTAADFDALIRGSHTARFRATLVEGFQTGTDPSGFAVRVIDGGVEYDASADVRSTGDVTVAEQWPDARDLKFAPYGSEVFLSRGVETGAAGVLWAPMGYYRISKTTQSDAAKGPIKLDVDDRMATIIDSRFLSPRQWLVGTLVGDIINEVVLEVYPDAVITWDDDSDQSQLGRSLIVEESRLEVIKTLADGLGKIVYWDEIGQLVFKDIPSETDVIWTVNAGPDGVMVQADRSISRDGVYNAVVVTGEGADDLTPVRSVAINAQESSPTFFYGPFGQVPRFYSSSFITTQSQADGAAVNLLRQSLGAPYDVGLSAVPNPAVRPYDVIRVVYNDGTREVHIVDRVSIPFDVETAISIATRQSAVIHVGVL
jgi:Domain of unknown function (DUF5047)